MGGATDTTGKEKGRSEDCVQKMEKRKRLQRGYKPASKADRLNIIYEFKVHRKSVKYLSTRYKVNYNTVRHILQLYNDFGRTRTKKYKRMSKSQLALLAPI